LQVEPKQVDSTGERLANILLRSSGGKVERVGGDIAVAVWASSVGLAGRYLSSALVDEVVD
jgi:hypothetical protein